MKSTCKKLACLALAILLSLTLVPSAAFAAESDDSAYADASVEDILVKATAKDGHINFGEAGDVEVLKYRDSSNVFVEQKTVLSVEDALKDVCSRRFNDNVDDTHRNYTFDYISYVSLSAAQGTIYNGYNTEGDTGAGVAGVLKYYYKTSATPSNAQIGDIRFVPKSAFSGDALISYYGYYYYEEKDGVTNDWVRKSSSYAGRLYISVGKQEPGISYATDGEPARFAAEDFSTYSLAVKGRTFRYITFTLPDTSKGTLYYNYVDEDIYDYAVASGSRFYRSSTPSMDNVYFVPKKGYSGTFLLDFKGVDSADSEITGSVSITVTAYGPEYANSSTGTFTYEVECGRSVTLKEKDFEDKCKSVTGSSFGHVTFAALPNYGMLYDDAQTYSSSNNRSRYVSVNKTYSDPSDIRYLADSDYVGTVTVPFVAYASDYSKSNGKWFDGTIAFVITQGDDSPLSYTVDAGKRVYFKADDFSSASYKATGYDINRIRFDSLPSSYSGSLFENGEAITSTGRTYYKDALGNLNFLAAGDFDAAVSIPFTGYADGYTSSNKRSFSGIVTISPSKASEKKQTAQIGSAAKTLVYYSNGTAVPLSQADILNVVASALPGTTVTSIYLNRPEYAEGSLRRDFVSLSRQEEFDSRRSYTPSEVDHISFLPKAGFSGTSRITYTVHNDQGNSFTGNIEFIVTQPTYSRYFNDMDSTAWAIPAVDFFRYYGATNGTSATSFGPNTDMRRGDFILLLSRAFSFPAVEGGSFADVESGKYYAGAIASAKSLGIISGGAEDSFRPESAISREDAGVYLYRALRNAGAIDPGSASGAVLAQFPDAADTAAYAVEAMDALVREGVFQGYVKSLLPKRTLSRAETITILYRALT